MKKRRLKGVATFVAFFYFATNCVMAHSTESNFWSDRRKTATAASPSTPMTLAALPMSLRGMAASPATGLNSFGSALSRNIEKSLPRSSSRQLTPLFQSLSSQFGSIRKVTLPVASKHQPKTIIHIQDVHMNPEAQENISQAVQQLMSSGHAGVVALEGAFGPVDLSDIRSFPNPEAVKIVGDYLLRENRISGAVYAGFVSPAKSPVFMGVDNKRHYNANVDAYRRSRADLKRATENLAFMKTRVNLAKIRTFNKDLRAFDSHMEDYRSGHLPMGDYVGLLSSFANGLSPQTELFKEASFMEANLDFKKIETERAHVFTALLGKLNKQESELLLNDSIAYRVGHINHTDYYQRLKNLCESKAISLARFPALNAYIQYVLLSDGIDPEKLMAEMSTLEEKAVRFFIRSNAERELMAQSNTLYLEGKLLRFALTPSEWRAYKNATHGESELLSFESFYREAECRNTSMAENTLRAMEKNNASIGVLVTGGFHSPGVDQLLTQAGVTVVNYVPKIATVESDDGTAYLSVFAQEKTPLDQLFQGEKLFLSGLVNQTSAAPALLQTTAARLENQTGKTILSAAVTVVGNVVSFVGRKVRLLVTYASDNSIRSVQVLVRVTIGAVVLGAVGLSFRSSPGLTILALAIGAALYKPAFFRGISEKTATASVGSLALVFGRPELGHVSSSLAFVSTSSTWILSVILFVALGLAAAFFFVPARKGRKPISIAFVTVVLIGIVGIFSQPKELPPYHPSEDEINAVTLSVHELAEKAEKNEAADEKEPAVFIGKSNRDKVTLLINSINYIYNSVPTADQPPLYSTATDLALKIALSEPDLKLREVLVRDIAACLKNVGLIQNAKLMGYRADSVFMLRVVSTPKLLKGSHIEGLTPGEILERGMNGIIFSHSWRDNEIIIPPNSYGPGFKFLERVIDEIKDKPTKVDEFCRLGLLMGEFFMTREAKAIFERAIDVASGLPAGALSDAAFSQIGQKAAHVDHETAYKAADGIKDEAVKRVIEVRIDLTPVLSPSDEPGAPKALVSPPIGDGFVPRSKPPTSPNDVGPLAKTIATALRNYRDGKLAPEDLAALGQSGKVGFDGQPGLTPIQPPELETLAILVDEDLTLQPPVHITSDEALQAAHDIAKALGNSRWKNIILDIPNSTNGDGFESRVAIIQDILQRGVIGDRPIYLECHVDDEPRVRELFDAQLRAENSRLRIRTRTVDSVADETANTLSLVDRARGWIEGPALIHDALFVLADQHGQLNNSILGLPADIIAIRLSDLRNGHLQGVQMGLMFALYKLAQSHA